MVENTYGQKTDDASNTFDKIRKLKMFSNEPSNSEIMKKMEDVTVELCIKCEDIIEEFCAYKDKIIFSKEKDVVARELLQNALVDSKTIFYEKNIYYNKTIEELTEIIEELEQKNKKLVEENTELVERIQKMEAEKEKLVEYIRKILEESKEESKVKKANTESKNLISIYGKFTRAVDNTDVLKILKRLQDEENALKKEQEQENIDKKEETQINQDSKEKE